LAFSPKAKLLAFVVLTGLILFAVFYYFVGINYSYMIRYPILIAIIILFVVAIMMLMVFMSREFHVPITRVKQTQFLFNWYVEYFF
jgi:hypothetical protein